MESTTLLHQLLRGTRRDVVLLLRSDPRTVRELSEELELTRNAIRSQLSNLERDGFVNVVGRRPTERKPEYVYGLTEEAEQLFPKSYDAVLNEVLTVLAAEESDEEMDRILCEVGRRLAWTYKPHELDLSPIGRLERAQQALQEMGGLPELKENGDVYTIEGVSCPLASVVQAHGERGCNLARCFLEELTELPVEQRCRVDGSCANCQFVVDLSDATDPST